MATYYCDYASGSNAADGSTGTPWQTLAYAESQCIAGDTIRLRGDSSAAALYRETAITANVQNLTIEADAGHTPHITISKVYTSWSATGGTTNVYETAYTPAAAWAVWNGATRLAEVGSVATCDSTTNSFYFNDAGDLLHVNIGGSAPSTIYALDTTSRVITISGATGITVRGLTFKYTALGISMAANSATVDDCTIAAYYPVFAAWSAIEVTADSCTISNSTLSAETTSNGYAIRVLSPADSLTVDGCTISACLYGVRIESGTGHLLQDSTITNTLDGVYVLTGTGSTVQRCAFIDNKHGDAIWEGTATANVYYNTCYHSTDLNVAGSHTFIFHNSGNTAVYHNVIAYKERNTNGSAENCGLHVSPTSGTLNIIAKNNAFYNLDMGITHSGAGTIAPTYDYNGFYSNAANFVAVDVGDQGTNNQTGDPLFTNPTSYDFTLGSSSPYINAGVAVTGINDGYSGAAPDIGRYEYVSLATLTQSAYRWRNDNGSETTATWAADEDAAHTVAAETNIRLRVQIDGSGDPDAAQFRLEYKKQGDADWSVVT